mmetsp:Transcript_87749/g.246561  ORF Transcript_87749/g.246561 Transcript_87749/m.246561 type:complete len:249 (+) Transcript_87749:924-1670(+)
MLAEAARAESSPPTARSSSASPSKADRRAAMAALSEHTLAISAAPARWQCWSSSISWSAAASSRHITSALSLATHKSFSRMSAMLSLPTGGTEGDARKARVKIRTSRSCSAERRSNVDFSLMSLSRCCCSSWSSRFARSASGDKGSSAARRRSAISLHSSLWMQLLETSNWSSHWARSRFANSAWLRSHARSSLPSLNSSLSSRASRSASPSRASARWACSRVSRTRLTHVSSSLAWRTAWPHHSEVT